MRNERKSRDLEDDLYEFKSPHGDRLIFFYDARRRRVTVITHGFRKGAKVENEKRGAKVMRERYYREGDNG